MASVGTNAKLRAADTSTRRPRRPAGPARKKMAKLCALDKRLLDEFQRDLPVCARPFAEIARRLGCNEATVIGHLAWLQRQGYVSRVGAVFSPNHLGASTLAAMAIPEDRLESVATLVSSYPEVNHNYEREHAFNLWFVVTAKDAHAVADVLADVQRRTGIAVMDLPLLEAFHIDLGFPLWLT